MIRSILLVAAMLAAPALAVAAPPSGSGHGPFGPGSATMDRSTFLVLGGSVTGALVAADTFELVRTGKPNDTIRGVGVLASFPLMLWGTEHIGVDHRDTASWAVTVASTGLVAYGLWPMIDRFVLGHQDANDDDSDQDMPIMPLRRTIHAGPTAIVGPHGSTGAGLGVVATF